MDELLERFLAGQRAFGERVHAVAEHQWTAATPDREWSVADLVSHLIDEHRWLPPRLRGLDLAAAGEVVAGTRNLPVDGGVGANLATSWDEAATAAHHAAVEPGGLERTVALSRGDTPARDYLREMTVDLAVHAWDLGAAIGYSAPLPEDLAEWALVEVSQWHDLESTGFFAVPVPVPDDAPAQHKLVAATGRDPNWSAT
jgi:uncharacterized protein (TIGR03086 family)